MPVSYPARPEAALSRLRAICGMAQRTAIKDLRTHLDEWAAFHHGGYLITRGGRQIWLNYPCPWPHFERLRRHMDWVTPEAEVILARAERRDPVVKKPRRGIENSYRLIVEHAVPIRVLGEHIQADPALRDVRMLEAFLLVHFRRGLLTKREDGLLNGAGLRQIMPSGWQAGEDPFARYAAIKLQRHDYGFS